MKKFNLNQTSNPAEAICELETYYNTGAIYLMLESYYQWLGTTVLPFIAKLTTFLANIF